MKLMTSIELTFNYQTSEILLLIEDYSIGKFHIKVYTEMLVNDINLSQCAV